MTVSAEKYDGKKVLIIVVALDQNELDTMAHESSVIGWAINCVGDQYAEGKRTGPVWRGSNGPGHDDIGTFEVYG
jgi:hypothetical protein